MKEMLDWINFDVHLPITDPTWIFFLVLVIILFAPIVLERLRIPHIIGMILAGVIVGEHGFNILARDSSFELFGKVGLYYIMFLAGLEMNMEDFKSIRGKATVPGLLPLSFRWVSVSGPTFTCWATGSSVRCCWPVCTLLIP